MLSHIRTHAASGNADALPEIATIRYLLLYSIYDAHLRRNLHLGIAKPPYWRVLLSFRFSLSALPVSLGYCLKRPSHLKTPHNSDDRFVVINHGNRIYPMMLAKRGKNILVCRSRIECQRLGVRDVLYFKI